VVVANTAHVLLALLVAAVLVVEGRSHPGRVRRFLAWPFTVEGWRALVLATIAIPLAFGRLLSGLAPGRARRDGGVGLPAAIVLLAAVAAVCYVPFRSGVQVLAGLDPNFTGDAWGGPSYLGAALAHWLDGLLIFYLAAAVVRVLSRRRLATGPLPAERRLAGVA